MQVVQCKLRCENTTMVAHIDKVFKKQPIKQGMKIELKDDPRIWVIEEIFADSEIDRKDLHRTWNNNI
jgi:hypothetical protein